MTAYRSDSYRIVGEHFAMADAERLDPTLLAVCERDEKSQFDELGHGKMLVQFFPQRGVGDFGVPDDCAGIRQRDFFSFGKLIRSFKAEQLIVVFF
jgi:hypothetical protein